MVMKNIAPFARAEKSAMWLPAIVISLLLTFPTRADDTSVELIVDRYELRMENEVDTLFLASALELAGPEDTFALELEAEHNLSDHVLEAAEWKLIWSRKLSSTFNSVLGIRYDTSPVKYSYAVIGLAWNAPLEIDTGVEIEVREDGFTIGKLGLAHKTDMSAGWYTIAKAELEVSPNNSVDEQVGRGLAHFKAALRLYKQTTPDFAPYIGVKWESDMGTTRDLVQSAGNDPDSFVFILGISGTF